MTLLLSSLCQLLTTLVEGGPLSNGPPMVQNFFKFVAPRNFVVTIYIQVLNISDILRTNLKSHFLLPCFGGLYRWLRISGLNLNYLDCKLN